MIAVTLNGSRRELPDGATLADALAAAGAPGAGRGCAIALDGEVVPRRVWERMPLSDGARVEVVAAVQGG
jgi:sulfur carrier protein